MTNWRDYEVDDPQALRAFIEYQLNELTEAGWWFEPDEEKASVIYNTVINRTMQELKEHIDQNNKTWGL